MVATGAVDGVDTKHFDVITCPATGIMWRIRLIPADDAVDGPERASIHAILPL
ncbi:hypothetical protein SAMN05421543_102218 [Alicyclobacillus macrosporangiidus]|uniref:Uncharacterized protein n=1 Tax=Alicyclobacillus macrosporangiidus TaxID=392015 RepID=A0A1I7GIK1_9BACL|nr:hypothetical protein SAMN05421543_102218 [Alicyclobacillus macrosporangiidus]